MPEPQQITLEMGLTPKVFADTLPNASHPYRINASGSSYQLSYQERHITIQLIELPARKIAGLSLPVTRIEFNFANHTAEQVEQYMQRFMRYFHRGGG